MKSFFFTLLIVTTLSLHGANPDMPMQPATFQHGHRYRYIARCSDSLIFCGRAFGLIVFVGGWTSLGYFLFFEPQQI